ncbi:hypothetical protein M1563_01350 [Patescibacteria group bacterium]|nr:hypothetical protein [Patescibacteria group bacterium]MCL5410082.1 hypothetical protein [Patescibacteria group bacterium]
MKSKKRRVARSSRKQSSFLSLDFLKHHKTPFHGATLGLGLIVLGSLVAIGIVTIIGIIVFVPSMGAMIIKFVRTRLVKI